MWIHFIKLLIDTKFVLNLLSRRHRLSKPLGHVVKLSGLWTEKENKDRVGAEVVCVLCDPWLMLIWPHCINLMEGCPGGHDLHHDLPLLPLCPPLSRTWWVPGPHLLSYGWSLQRDTLDKVSFSVFTVMLSYLWKQWWLHGHEVSWHYTVCPHAGEKKRFLNTDIQRALYDRPASYKKKSMLGKGVFACAWGAEISQWFNMILRILRRWWAGLVSRTASGATWSLTADLHNWVCDMFLQVWPVIFF